ncbi:MAG: hypothetical protein N2560_09005 [Ignavibacteria bacterium]|nr:hypothetical protein [Ignavibacteria bacterium]
MKLKIQKFTKFFSIIFLCLVLIWGCQCIPSLDTEKDITPSQYSRIMCVNCAPLFDKVKIVVGEFTLHNSLDYDMEEGFKYFNVLPGVTNFVVIYKSDSVLYNGFANLSKGLPYTFLIIQLQKRIKGLLLYDTLSTYSPTNSYFRFVNVAVNSPSSLVFQIEQQYPIYFPLGFRSFTKFFTTYPEKYRITIKDADKDTTLFDIKNFQFLAGKGYSIILRGDFQTKETKLGTNLLIIQHNFDEIYNLDVKK